jgi:IclR family KDG regulon transcriptional repressor
MNKSKTQAVPAIKSAERVLDLLELLSREPTRGFSMDEIIDQLDIPRSSFYSLSKMLIHRGYIHKPSEGKYKLGIKTFEIGSSYVSNVEVIDVAAPVIKELNSITKETVNITVFDKNTKEIIVISRETGLNSLRFVSSLGDRLPAYQTASGRLFLSEYSDDEIQEFYVETLEKETINNLILDLRDIREWGYSENNGTTYNGVFIIAVPIYDHTNEVVAALNIGVPMFQLEQTGKGGYLSLITPAASYISYLMGHNQEPLIKDTNQLLSIWEGLKMK